MGQFWNLTHDIANADYFSECDKVQIGVERVMAAEEVLNCAYRLLHGPSRKKTQQMLIAEELYTQIRHELFEECPVGGRTYWSVASNEPLKLTDEPRIKIERRKK